MRQELLFFIKVIHNHCRKPGRYRSLCRFPCLFTGAPGRNPPRGGGAAAPLAPWPPRGLGPSRSTGVFPGSFSSAVLSGSACVLHCLCSCVSLPPPPHPAGTVFQAEEIGPKPGTPCFIRGLCGSCWAPHVSPGWLRSSSSPPLHT